ncbi:DUF5312 family protein [Treponema sp. HNW]|uniref:DUF5312 family protein n=1 Tax=Treponema sp. HNW TaxID=3116654 RepID=UPI003D109379
MAKKGKMSGIGLFERLLGLFIPSDAEAQKNRLLKNIYKELGKTKVKFYKYNSGEALPQLAKFFFDIYKVVGPAQPVFKNTPNPNTFKHMVIDYYMTDVQRELAESLEEESILERAKSTPVKDLAAQVKNELAAYLNGFDVEKITKIDMLYTKLSQLIAFCTFDYYFLLRKFDSGMQEQNFSYTPKFEMIRAEYILEDLKDFTTVAWALPLEDDWSEVFKVLKEYRNVQPIAMNTWNKLTNVLRKYRDKAVLEMTIQLISKDPAYQTVITAAQEHIIDDQLDKMRKTVDNTLQKVQSDRKNSQIDELVHSIFGSGSIMKLKNYSDEGNKGFEKRNLSGFTLCAPMDYLKSFLLDYVKRNVREFADLVLVRGQWVSSVLASPMSDAYHELMNISNKITEFDSSLDPEKEMGQKIKGYLVRAERDPEAKNILKSLTKDINEKAYNMLSAATRDLIVIGKNTKNLLEDIERKEPEMIINWAELTHFAENPIKEQGVDIYKKIYLFVNLMKCFLSNEG